MPLLLAHLQALEPERLSARERLEVALGPELTRLLIGALAAGGGTGRSRSRSLAA
jgi:hypothetical protein